MKSSDAQDLVTDAMRYADEYAAEAGFRRRASRLSVPNARVSWFVRDVPEYMASPAWYCFDAYPEKRTKKEHTVQSIRMAESAPRPF